MKTSETLYLELKSFDGVKVTKPDGIFYCLAKFGAYGEDSENYLPEKTKAITNLRKDFGPDGPLELGFCGSIKDIREGIAGLIWLLDLNCPNEIFIRDENYQGIGNE